jgi:hypothetical protein
MSAITEDGSVVEKRKEQEQEVEEEASSHATAVVVNDLQAHRRNDTEAPPSAFAVHPVDIGFADAPDNGGVRPATSPNQSKDNDVKCGIDTTQMPWRLEIVPLMLLSLPIDSLHCIASFLSASDWASFGQTSVGANRVGREVFRRVRMHGFRCATEVVTAWVSLLFLFGPYHSSEVSEIE